MLSDHLVTVSDDEVILLRATTSATMLPELEDATTTNTNTNTKTTTSSGGPVRRRRSGGGDPGGADDPGGSESADISHPPRNIPPPQMPVHHKMLYQSLSSLASPVRSGMPSTAAAVHRLTVGPERDVHFHTDSLGIKISRHTDGYVRVLSVSPYRPFAPSSSSADAAIAVAPPPPPSSPEDGGSSSSSSMSSSSSGLVREGEIRPGDVVREVGGVNLRVPIDSAVWKLTVGLVRMAPRPLKFVVARELPRGATTGGDDDDDEYEYDEDDDRGGAGGSSSPHAADGARRRRRRRHHGDVTDRTGDNTTTTAQQQQQMEEHRSFFVPPDGAREVTFHQSCLGVKLRHDPAGRVRVLDVTPYRSFPNSPLARTGDIRPGDVVLDVNGGCGDAMWDLSGGGPIDARAWADLIGYIRSAGRPLRMTVVAAGADDDDDDDDDDAAVDDGRGSREDASEEEEEEDEVVVEREEEKKGEEEEEDEKEDHVGEKPNNACDLTKDGKMGVVKDEDMKGETETGGGEEEEEEEEEEEGHGNERQNACNMAPFVADNGVRVSRGDGGK